MQRTTRPLALAITLWLAAACGHRPPPPVARDASADARVLAIADAYVADTYEQYPERPTLLRVPGVRFDYLPDDSLAGVRARALRRAAWLAELRAIDAQGLGGNAALAYAIARGRLDDESALRVCRLELWTVSQMLNGWPVRFTNLAQAQPVGTDDLRRQTLARFGAVPRYADAQIANLRAGERLGYRAAQVNVRLVIAQLDALLALPPAQSPFFSPAARDGDAAFQAELGALIREQIDPALQRHRDFLRDEYLPRARTAVGVAANPDGASCYRAAARYASTEDLDPAAIHSIGLAQLAAVQAEMQALSARSFGGAAVPALLLRFKTDPRYRYRDAAAVLAQAQAAIDRAQAALPRAFGLRPTAPAVLEPIPAFQERTAAPHYLPAALDGSRPAEYRVRLYQPEQQSTVIGESTAYHEVVPGHHLQVNIADNRTGLPAVARFVSNSGFSEGWALYAERLSDELGLYSSAADRFGMLSNFAWRAVRMVVDTGLHVQGWERQRAIDFLLASTALSPDQAGAEIDRYIAWPGQAPSYMIGYMEIIALRQHAQQGLGARFALADFHDRVLENGNVPLPVLHERMGAWIAVNSAAPSLIGDAASRISAEEVGRCGAGCSLDW